MWHPSRPSIRFRIKALDQHDLSRRLRPQAMPPMSLIRPYRKRLTNAVGVDKFYRQKVLVRHGCCICNTKRVLANGLDGSPDIDDLVAASEQALCISGTVVPDTIGTGFVGLIDMDALHRAAEWVLCWS